MSSDNWRAPSRGSSTFLSRWARALLPPFAAFVLARGLLFLAAFKAGQVPWLADAWGRWDSGHYLSRGSSPDASPWSANIPSLGGEG